MNVKGWCVLACIFLCKTMKETFFQPSLIIRQLGLHANGHNIVDQQLPIIAGCYMLRPFAHPVACCCAKFETGQTFQPTTPNISFVPWSPNRSATMLDPFTQLFQHFWGHAHSLCMVYKDLQVVSFPRCTVGPNIVGSCCIHLHTIPNTQTKDPNIVGATMLGVVASVCMQP